MPTEADLPPVFPAGSNLPQYAVPTGASFHPHALPTGAGHHPQAYSAGAGLPTPALLSEPVYPGTH